MFKGKRNHSQGDAYGRKHGGHGGTRKRCSLRSEGILVKESTTIGKDSGSGVSIQIR